MWLTIDDSSGKFSDGDQSKILAAIRRQVGAAEVNSVLRGSHSVWLLIALDTTTLPQLVKNVLGGGLSEFGVTHARVVDLAECDRDAKYIQRMLAKDETALAEMLADFAADVERSLKRRFREVLDASEVDEAINVAAVNVWRSASQFNPGKANLAGWFYKIAERELINGIRANGVHGVPLEIEPAEKERIGWLSTSVPANAQLLADLNNIIEELPGVQKAVVLADLAAGERADDDRLAKRLKTSVNVVRVSRDRARKKIHDQLIELGHILDGEGKPS